jgi:hypothetical protein
VLTLCDGQVAVSASNCTLCGYVLEYYSALFICLSQFMAVHFLIAFNEYAVEFIHRNTPKYFLNLLFQLHFLFGTGIGAPYGSEFISV